MNFKLLLALSLIPFVALAQNRTNEFDNVLINRGITFKGGTPGANKVLTSDAAGNYTPQTITSLNGTIVTNVALVSTPFIVMSGQGTPVLTITGVGTVVTNGASPTFVNLTTSGLVQNSGVVTNSSQTVMNGQVTVNAFQTNNMTLTTSNIIMRGGMVFARTTKSANYTNTINDYYIAWTGTTAATVTNFLPTGVLNGRTYVIKDSQRSASTTNIIIKPLGSDTILGTSSFPININGQSVTITYDGVSNWEPN